MFVFSFLEKLIEVDCGENHCPLSQVAESRWKLLANIFSAHGVSVGARENKNVATLIPRRGNLVVARHAMENFPRDTR